MGEQLKYFSAATKDTSLATPTNWQEAFAMLTTYQAPLIRRQKKVVFFDESHG